MNSSLKELNKFQEELEIRVKERESLLYYSYDELQTYKTKNIDSIYKTQSGDPKLKKIKPRSKYYKSINNNIISKRNFSTSTNYTRNKVYFVPLKNNLRQSGLIGFSKIYNLKRLI